MKDLPFTSHFVKLPDGNIHYIDEGQGPVILFSHGTPEWLFAYRHIIQALSSEYRCIALDHLGFGYSDKPPQADYTIFQQARRFEEFVKALNLEKVSLVANDFGVSIALSYALNHPSNVRCVSISNGWMWSLKNDPHFARPGKILQGWLGKLLYMDFNFSVKVMMPSGYGDRSKLTRDVHQQYIEPFSRRSDRIATLVYAGEILNASDWWEGQWNRLDNLNKIPFHLFWGMRDSFLRPKELQMWRMKLAQCTVTEIPNSGHFPHEEAPEKMIAVLRNFFSAYAIEGLAENSGLRPNSFMRRA